MGRGAQLNGFDTIFGSGRKSERQKTAWLPSDEAPMRSPGYQEQLQAPFRENSFVILGNIKRLLEDNLRGDKEPEEIKEITEAYIADATSSDHEHLIETTRSYLIEHLGISDEDPGAPRVGFKLEQYYGENAFTVMGVVVEVLKMVLGRQESRTVVDTYRAEAMSSDYAALIETSRRYLWQYCHITTAPYQQKAPRCRECNSYLQNPEALYCDNCA